MDLFDDSDSDTGGKAVASSSAPKLSVNREFANRFEHNKERAELHRLEEKYGKRKAGELSDDDDESDSEDETEDEEGEQVTAEVDAAILRTLAKIRSGDSSIYDADKKVFDEEKALAAASAMLPKATRAKVNKKVTLADYQRNRMRDLMNSSEDPALALAEATTSRTRDDERDEDMYGAGREEPLSHVQEQEKLRKQVTQAFHTMGQDEEEEADFFTKSGAADEETEPEAYKRYLLANLGEDKGEAALREVLKGQIEAPPPRRDLQLAEQAAEVEKPKTKKRKAKGQPSDEDFLMSYILNRGWIYNPEAAPKPSSRSKAKREEAGSAEEGASGPIASTSGRDWDAEAADLDNMSESSFDSAAEAFEQAYNFRFEAMEAGKAPAQVQSFARNTLNSVRRTEDKRKQEREDRKKRKEAEKLQRMQDLDRMRDLKKGQVRDKLKQLREAAGSQKIKIDEKMLEGDFDPEKWDQMMEAFGDDYYAEDDEGKPVWDDDLDIDEILAEEEEQEAADQGQIASKKSKNKSKKEKRKKEQAANGEENEGEIEMDADYLDGNEPKSVEEEVKLSKKERKKLKKKAKHAAERAGEDEGDVDMDAAMPVASSSKSKAAVPELSAEERRAKAKQLAEEYHNLDYEDVVGDLATRFHYTNVLKSDYGLSPVEILLADDDDLNNVVGLKHLQPYRKGTGKPRNLNMKLKDFRRKLDAKEQSLEGRSRDSGYGQRASRSGEEGQQQPKKRMGKKERMKKAAAEAAAAGGTVEAVATNGGSNGAAAKSESKPAPTSSPPNPSATKVDPLADEAEVARRRKEKKERKKAAKKAEAAQVEASSSADAVPKEERKKNKKVKLSDA